MIYFKTTGATGVNIYRPRNDRGGYGLSVDLTGVSPDVLAQLGPHRVEFPFALGGMFPPMVVCDSPTVLLLEYDKAAACNIRRDALLTGIPMTVAIKISRVHSRFGESSVFNPVAVHVNIEDVERRLEELLSSIFDPRTGAPVA